MFLPPILRRLQAVAPGFTIESAPMALDRFHASMPIGKRPDSAFVGPDDGKP